MAQRYIPISLVNGILRAYSKLRMPEGFLRTLRNWYYKLNDPTRIWRVPGRALAGTTSATNPKGIAHLQYDNADDKLVVLANGKLYESTVGQTGLTFTAAKDGDGNDLSVSGSYLRAIGDGRNGWVTHSGSGRGLIRDVDGSWRKFGLQRARNIPSITTGTSSNSFHPNTFYDWPEYSYRGVTANEELAYDVDKDTYSLLEGWETPEGPSWYGATVDWYHTSSTDNVNGETLHILIECPYYYTNPPGAEGGVISVVISEDGGTTWDTIFQRTSAFSTTEVLHTLGNVQWKDVRVRVEIGVRSSATNDWETHVRVYEIYAGNFQSSSGLVAGQKLTYCVSEAYRKELSDGSTVMVESEPSDVFSYSASGSEASVIITLPSRANSTGDGYSDSTTYWRIYRSATNGNWPNLGLIAEIPITNTAYEDSFSTPVGELPTPALPVLKVNNVYEHRNVAPPQSVADLAYYRGAFVGISPATPNSISWSLPGEPEYWPRSHNITTLPSERNDRIQGLTSINDRIIVWYRTRTISIANLPFATDTVYDPTRIAVDVLTETEGLVAGVRGYTHIQNRDGNTLAVWISHSGLWMTDGYPRSTAAGTGMGVQQLLRGQIDWQTDVDLSRLSEALLVFDPGDQIVRFQCYDPTGRRVEYWLHVSPEQWVKTPSGPAPKVSGPHPVSNSTAALIDLISGEYSSQLNLWSLDSQGRVWTERYGTADNANFSASGGDIVAVAETGWIYPAGPMGEVDIRRGIIYHTDWGDLMLELDLQARNEGLGTVQTLSKRDLVLKGERGTIFEVIGKGSGHSVKLQLVQRGQTMGAIDQVVLRGILAGETEE